MRSKEKLIKGLEAAFRDKWKTSSTILISTIFFVLLALSTSINYSLQMFSAGLKYWIPAVQFTIRGFYLNGGWMEVALNIVYSLLVGIVISNTYTQFKATGLEVGNLSGVAPGVLVAGCAGCGVGLLSLLGVAGLVTVLPFQGLSLKIGGMILIIYFIAKTGDPRTCSIPSSS